MPLLKSRGNTVIPEMDLTEPDALLQLQRLDGLPMMQAAILAKVPLSSRYDALDTEIRQAERQMRLYAQQEITAAFQAEVDGLTARITELTTARATVLADLEHANERIEQARAEARRDILPGVSDLALPIIRARIEVLDILAMVQRLVVPKSPAYLPARQMLSLERDYLVMLRDVLEGSEG
jgi:septal ring factor EnvC (AmiA/AmiB activator)